MQGNYKSSTWERRKGVTAGGYPGDCCWSLQDDARALDYKWSRRCHSVEERGLRRTLSSKKKVALEWGGTFWEGNVVQKWWNSMRIWRRLLNKWMTWLPWTGDGRLDTWQHLDGSQFLTTTDVPHSFAYQSLLKGNRRAELVGCPSRVRFE